jgi:hypothetical protein
MVMIVDLLHGLQGEGEGEGGVGGADGGWHAASFARKQNGGSSRKNFVMVVTG